jgi:glycosyltransferase involved in cell wall biosynthesis
MELTLMRVTKIELGEIRNLGTCSARTVTITMKDGTKATVVCFADNDEYKEPTEDLKVIL